MYAHMHMHVCTTALDQMWGLRTSHGIGYEYIPQKRNPNTEKQPQLILWTHKYTYSPSSHPPGSVYNCIVDFFFPENNIKKKENWPRIGLLV